MWRESTLQPWHWVRPVDSSDCTFLGMHFSDGTETLVTNVYDKRKDFSFPVIRYPHMDSLVPLYIPYGVLLGQLHRYYRICSEGKHFLAHSVELAQTLVKQGSGRRLMVKGFGAFLERKRSLRYSLSLNNLVRQFRKGLST